VPMDYLYRFSLNFFNYFHFQSSFKLSIITG